MKLNFIRFTAGSNQTVPLQASDRIDKGGMSPEFSSSLRLRGGYDVSRRLFDDREPIEFPLTDDRRLPRSRRTGDDEPSQKNSN